ncbi:hypothetical protein D3C85_1850010 [compost metagenome]
MKAVGIQRRGNPVLQAPQMNQVIRLHLFLLQDRKQLLVIRQRFRVNCIFAVIVHTKFMTAIHGNYALPAAP